MSKRTYIIYCYLKKSNNNTKQMKDVGDVDRTHNTKI
jgi:hypothetical protein